VQSIANMLVTYSETQSILEPCGTDAVESVEEYWNYVWQHMKEAPSPSAKVTSCVLLVRGCEVTECLLIEYHTLERSR
jgi:hypothetical protein